MHVSRSIVLTVGIAAISMMGARVHAAAIASLNPGGHQSTVSAFAEDDDNGLTTTNDVNSLPFTTPTMQVDGENSSTVGSNLTNSALNFTFTQAINDTQSPGETSGTGDIFFTAGAGTTYTIAGMLSGLGDFETAELKTFLLDVTTGTYLYNYDVDTGANAGVKPAGVSPDCVVVAPTTLTLDSTGGSLTGSLTAGDTYEFQAFESMEVNISDPSLTGNSGLSLVQTVNGGGGSTVPLPMGIAGALLALSGIGMVGCRRKVGVV